MALTARTIMTPDPQWVGEEETVLTAAQLMMNARVGAIPICGIDNRVKGMVTACDIVMKVLAQGRNPGEVRSGELTPGAAVTVEADDDADKILRIMISHRARRLPVVAGHDLVGVVAQADVARSLMSPSVRDLLAALSTD